ncbi:MAG: SDR family NAD(P)-dependent oxidoreductase [Anaerolineales bacterium]|nr:SDR family NAD(P)-dependent oxidoreductase [Anaerolineales bacterium]MDW8279168.1 SDR family NAD(P)-dependent oxidoreductase [Anaerolineales bacterium]
MNPFWREKKVLVTGAGGFIGSHLVERLTLEGAQVRAFVRYNSRADTGLLQLAPPEIRASLEIIGGDLRDEHAVRKAVEGCQVVLHLGALISIPYSYYHPVEVTQTNVIGTLNVLNACREAGVERLVHTSTSEVYGTAQQVPIREEHPLQGQSPYSASKIGADKLAESFYCAFGLPVVILRPFNTYGPRQSARAVIPAVITQALTQPVIRVGNVHTTRDFTFIHDTVNAFLLAAQTPGIEGKTIHLGTGVEIRIADVVEKIVSKVNRPVEIQVEEQRLRPEASEVYRLVSDNTQARQVLGWAPQTTLDQGLEKTIEWIRQHLERYRVGVYEF